MKEWKYENPHIGFHKMIYIIPAQSRNTRTERVASNSEPKIKTKTKNSLYFLPSLGHTRLSSFSFSFTYIIS